MVGGTLAQEALIAASMGCRVLLYEPVPRYAAFVKRVLALNDNSTASRIALVEALPATTTAESGKAWHRCALCCACVLVSRRVSAFAAAAAAAQLLVDVPTRDCVSCVGVHKAADGDRAAKESARAARKARQRRRKLASATHQLQFNASLQAFDSATHDLNSVSIARVGTRAQFVVESRKMRFEVFSFFLSFNSLFSDARIRGESRTPFSTTETTQCANYTTFARR